MDRPNISTGVFQSYLEDERLFAWCSSCGGLVPVRLRGKSAIERQNKLVIEAMIHCDKEHPITRSYLEVMPEDIMLSVRRIDDVGKG